MAIGQCLWVIGEGEHCFHFQRRFEERPRNYKAVSLPSVPGKNKEQILLGDIVRNMQDEEVTQSSWHSSIKG